MFSDTVLNNPIKNKPVLDNKNDNMIIWCMSIVAVMLSYYYISNYFSNIMYEHETQSNASYPILYLLPFMLCHRNKALKIGFMIVVLIVVMYSLKRGGIVALSCGLITYFYISQIRIKNRKISIVPAISLIIVIVGLLYFIRYFNENILSGMLSDRLSDSVDSGGSGRLDIYKYYWNVFKDSSLSQLIIGRGWLGSIRSGSMGLTCHNDILEVLIDFGIIGLSLYTTFIISLIKNKNYARAKELIDMAYELVKDTQNHYSLALTFAKYFDLYIWDNIINFYI